MNTTRLSLTGITCAGCVSRVETALNNVEGVVLASVNLAERTASVDGDVRADDLIGTVTCKLKIKAPLPFKGAFEVMPFEGCMAVNLPRQNQ